MTERERIFRNWDLVFYAFLFIKIVLQNSFSINFALILIYPNLFSRMRPSKSGVNNNKNPNYRKFLHTVM